MKTLRKLAERDRGLAHVFGEFIAVLSQLDGRRGHPVQSFFWQNAIGAERVVTGYLMALLWANIITDDEYDTANIEKADALWRGKKPEVML